MEVIYRKLSDMKKLDGNPRKITQEQLETLKQSIERNKDYFEARPLILSNRMGELIVIAGNQRYEACKQLGIEECPTVLLEGLTEEREKEIIIRDNVSNGEWDEELLQEWDSELLNDWGVDISDMKCFEEPVSEAEEDDFDEDTDEIEPVCKEGDLWQLGEHRLLCGDSTKPECMEILSGGVKMDLLITDPPYNVAYVGKTKDALTIQNDSMEDDAFRSFLTDAFISADSIMKQGASFYIWHADSEGFNFRYAVKAVGWMLKQNLVWVKNSLVMGRQDYQWKHEPCLYGWKDGASHNWYAGRSETTTLEFDRPNRNDLHPTMKPIPLFAYQIQNSTKEGDCVLDSFGGSGTTLIACEQLKRKAFLMELDPHYCDVIIARWEKLTGKKAEKIN